MLNNFLRDKQWILNNIDYVDREIKRIDCINIRHIEDCPGCKDCNHLMDFYSGCECCGVTGHKGVLNYIIEEGFYLCDNCFEKYDNI